MFKNTAGTKTSTLNATTLMWLSKLGDRSHVMLPRYVVRMSETKFSLKACEMLLVRGIDQRKISNPLVSSKGKGFNLY